MSFGGACITIFIDASAALQVESASKCAASRQVPKPTACTLFETIVQTLDGDAVYVMPLLPLMADATMLASAVVPAIISPS